MQDVPRVRPARPLDETARQAALDACRILDTPPEAAFDDLVSLAAVVCDVPMAVVSLVDRERQWFKARIGIEDRQTSRDLSFCAHAILQPERTMVVPDTHEDERFRDHPLVLGAPGLRFYAGAPLRAAGGEALGTVCVLDERPRQLTEAQQAALEALSRQAARLMDLHRVSAALRMQLDERAWYEQQLLHYQHELELQNADLTEQSTTDALTGLANRRAFAHALEDALAAAQARETLSVAIIDIDHFKAINDRYGHPEGDRVLQALGARLRGLDVTRGRIARYGGEEFVRLMPGTAAAEALDACERLRADVEAMAIGVPLTVSIGIATWSPGDEASSLLARADAALYDAKHAGRNRVRAR